MELLDLPAPSLSAEVDALLPPSESHVEDAPTPNLSSEADLLFNSSTNPMPPKLRKGKSQAPIDTASLRHNNRSNKYDGFKVPPLTDSKIKLSKVKPRQVPSALTIRDTPTEHIPPATPFQVIQQIGTNLRGIPANEPSKEALMAAQEEEPASST